MAITLYVEVMKMDENEGIKELLTELNNLVMRAYLIGREHGSAYAVAELVPTLADAALKSQSQK